MKRYTIDEAVREVTRITQQAQDKLSGLSAAQLNWRPHPSAWSAGAVLDHLITSNSTYLPVFTRMSRHTYDFNLFEKLRFFSKFWGSLLVNAVAPDTTRKLKSPPVFRPSSSAFDTGILQRFIAHQSELSEAILSIAGLDLHHTIMSSPAARSITYTLADCVTILVLHEQRHLQQIDRLLSHPSFPGS